MPEGAADSGSARLHVHASSDAMARLAAGTAHELNNPLSVIVGYLSLILNGQTSPGLVQEQLRRVEAEAKHCRAVLAGLGELAESALAAPETLDLRAVLAQARSTLGASPPLTVSILSETGTLVRGQPRGLTNLILHAVRNALEASARSVSVVLTSSAGQTRLELKDDGAGMSKEVLASAREPFFSTKPGRLGLGLAVCEAVAWAHGGSLALSSREGRGTTLALTLPSLSPNPEMTA